MIQIAVVDGKELCFAAPTFIAVPHGCCTNQKRHSENGLFGLESQFGHADRIQVKNAALKPNFNESLSGSEGLVVRITRCDSEEGAKGVQLEGNAMLLGDRQDLRQGRKRRRRRRRTAGDGWKKTPWLELARHREMKR